MDEKENDFHESIAKFTIDGKFLEHKYGSNTDIHKEIGNGSEEEGWKSRLRKISVKASEFFEQVPTSGIDEGRPTIDEKQRFLKREDVEKTVDTNAVIVKNIYETEDIVNDRFVNFASDGSLECDGASVTEEQGLLNKGNTEDGWKSRLQKITVKTTKVFDLTPHNGDIVHYCRNLINTSFHGEIQNPHTMKRLSVLMNNSTELTLALFLQSMDVFLRSFGDVEVTGEEEEFVYFMHGLMEKRSITDTQSFWKDAKRFLKLYKKRGTPSEELHHHEYWGTKQQLLAGKVIGDFIDKENGPLDPVFGVLLCPVAGRAGPGDSGVVHTILFDGDGPLAYHSAAHDAFGYLITFHGIGPGYNYVGASAILNPTRCMSGQVSGLYFWKEMLKHRPLGSKTT